ncbi:hypothetical protein [Pseudacidobacterium ailaaui]|jgi:hypothetical protein|uniref:hypothetical protein n=1 Tax=Pseudacidobacterium ailaaui TaxID=1382359 RepID=UPI00047BE1D3|nr:hypothetical protein [Pseudacidobacterium ailaaui]MCL6464862.1 hypothetical protein [Pseudacidobacterium ailaaui]MDI3253322.1 hypothetical protein [Bacillota bacterium]
MYFIWVLLGMVLVALIYSACQVWKPRKRRLPDCVYPLSAELDPALSRGHSGSRPAVKWIGMNDFQILASRLDALIVIDFRPEQEKRPLPPEVKHVLPVSPGQAIRVLASVPPEYSVVLCGGSDFCTFMASAIRNLKGFAPVYALKDPPDRKEAA